ncbi:retinoic acid-induced protein 2-like [Scleropages formosus]|uniref:Retinoic acid induced 2 n=1 Tax=Scleropages formosus TaxID=113540 RepID=A0A8C9RAR8_SCLFO|nr:retinoic acid-induced protein 2-like [Scleropages formosus]
MEDLYKDSQTNLPLDMSSPPSAVTSTDGGDGNGKSENGTVQLITSEAWNMKKKPLSPVMTVPASSVVSPSTESPGGMALKVAATVLQPICLGDSPVVLPIHLQMAGSAAPQISAAGSTPYLMTSQGPISLPLVLEQQVFQHLNSPVLQQGSVCPSLSLQNNILCQNSSLSFSQAPTVDQKPGVQPLEPGILPLLQNPGFAAVLQDLFPSQSNLNHSTCHTAASTPADNFTSTIFPPLPFPHSYSSSLSPLVPPATLLVPYPVVVPLPVPLPIPIPIPFPLNSDLKGFTDPPKPPCTLDKSTQTYTKENPSPPPQQNREGITHIPQVESPCSPSDIVEVLDLSIKNPPIQTKQEVIFQSQDNVLDLSVASVRTPCIQPHSNKELLGEKANHSGHICENKTGSALSFEVFRPMECTQNLDSKILNGLASLEFSRQHKWVVDSGSSRSGCESKCGSGNIEIVRTSQTAKVIVSVKDAVPTIFCGKLKGLSGVSTKNFSIKRDANQEAMLQQHYSIKAQVEPRDPNDSLKKASKSKPIKLKKMNSQEIHILPIKKQRLSAFFPRK